MTVLDSSHEAADRAGETDPQSETGKANAGEPIAIVGMACRFPGADGLDAFWKLLAAGESAVTEGDPGSGVGRVGELFPDATVQSRACRFGAYLDELDRFDAAFFRISPVEAQLLDPQQRMMLETSWQALEDAGIDPQRLRDSRTGVYAGISNNEYRGLVLDADDTAEPAVSLYSVTGTSFNTAIGRVSYALGLAGPAIALDTACSSSLVAVHQAVSGLQRGEADLALAGGVHAIFSGRLLEMRASAGMLSPDGRCATFDEAANGYVRGEGCGILVLKRLKDAEADGDRIWAVIRSAALNQDGASPGLTVPSEEAQQRVMEDALRNAGLTPSDVDYVEAHGTGTTVGDPIEANSTGKAYGRGRDPNDPLLIGSVKTNMGHLEAAAGVAGVMKVVLSMNQGRIPRHLHFTTPTPAVDWDRLPLRVTAEAMEWPARPDRPIRAGVSGFGWSGTNAHVLIEGYGEGRSRDIEGEGGRDGAGARVAEGERQRPEPRRAARAPARAWPRGSSRWIPVSLPEWFGTATPQADSPAPRQARCLPLSGRSGDALRDLAARYLRWLDGSADEPASESSAGESLLADMAWTAGTGRSHFRHRAGLVFRDAASLRTGLGELAAPDAPVVVEQARDLAGKVAFAYTGQASQWVGMGRNLYDTEPVFRAVLDRCDEIIQALRGASLLDVMFGRGDDAGDIDDPAWTQPAIYAVECALTALWSSLGVRPDIVIGHSLGELAAAQAAEVFSLEAGLRFAATRGSLMTALPGEGAMAAVFASGPVVAAAVDEHNAGADGPGISVAADNGAHQVVSGPATEVHALLAGLEQQDIQVRRLRKSPAYHSALVEPVLDDLQKALSDVAISPPSLTYVSSMTGREIAPEDVLDGAYWRRQMRQPVAFRKAVATLAELGVAAVVEIGPHAVVGPMVALSWPESSGVAGPPAIIASLKRPSSKIPVEEAEDAFAAAVAAGYRAGLPIRFEGLFAGESRRRISLPGYPFQRERYWVRAPKRRRTRMDHTLLGARHESASGEVTYETEVFPSDPAWLADHRVFDRLIAPGALYGVAALAASYAENAGSLLIEDMQLHSPLIVPDDDAGADDEAGETGRTVQVVVDGAGEGSSRRVSILSRAAATEAWMLHAEGQISAAAYRPEIDSQVDLDSLGSDLPALDVSDFYSDRAEMGVDLGPSFRTLGALSAGAGEAVGEVAVPEEFAGSGLALHPLLLDGCFQVMAAARSAAGAEGESTYLPFGWERLWLSGKLPDRVICHARMRDGREAPSPDTGDGRTPEVLSADLRFYDTSGALVGELSGYTAKRATRATLLAAVEGLDELIYEMTWRDQPLAPGILSAEFLPGPQVIAGDSGPFTDYLAAEGVDADDRDALLAELEQLSRRYALRAMEQLGWERKSGETVDPPELRRRLGVLDEHEKLFRRLCEMLAWSGLLEEDGDDFVVAAGTSDPLPEALQGDPDDIAGRMAGRYSHGSNEIGLFRRSGGALPDVLRGAADPLTLLFSSDEPTAADLYMKAPVARAANTMLADAVRALVAGLPADRRLRVIEVGAGTGSATDAVLPELPSGRFDYVYTDISAGFFAEAEARFAANGFLLDYRVLDIEKDPLEQGFEAHGYDLLIASNVLHATRYLDETLAHCRDLLAPSGELVALENLRGQGWLDLTFGQLDGWWRFADNYRPHHALASPEVWRQALGDAGFEAVEVLGVDTSEAARTPDRGVILAQGPAEVTEAAGAWVIAADGAGVAAGLAADLAARNQAVVLAGSPDSGGNAQAAEIPGVVTNTLDTEDREAWRALVTDLPADIPLNGVVHMAAVAGHGPRATTGEMAADARRTAASALALLQGVVDADATPQKGVWLVTRGAQVLERERDGELAGALLWGMGKVAAREAPHLQPRMIDLDSAAAEPTAMLAEELLYPDEETHVAWRTGFRRAARLVQTGAGAERLPLPEGRDWLLEPDQAGALERLHVESFPPRALGPHDARIAVDATGLNFWDVFRSIGFIDEGLLGGEMCGRVLEVGSDVSRVAPGDRIVGLAFGTFGPEAVAHEDMLAAAPEDMPAAALATLPTAFVSAALSYELAELAAGDKVLIHAGAGGVGLAAIQLAHAAGAEVFTTASAAKRDFLRSLGVDHVFDSRSIAFGQAILEATSGKGVDVVLNSLTGEGFIDASLSCLAKQGRFVELARRDILSEEEMAEARPDVAYHILELDVLKADDPAWPGRSLRGVMKQLAAGEITPLIHSRWSLAEAAGAMRFMRAARHLGKIVLTNSPLTRGHLRKDRTYLVTGGLGGIGCVVAGWLADCGAGTIVLNGRRAPDETVQALIDSLRDRGMDVRVELADVTNPASLDAMLERVDRELAPLAGVIHSVGVLADSALGNQNWDRFQQVLWPKVLGAWHLHRATEHLDLDMFVLFSSVAGVLGNPGQANHAAANAFLDQLAAHRRALGLPGQAIAWGAWSGLGEAEEQRERIAAQLEASGTGWIEPKQGLRAFERLVREDIGTAVVAAVDWDVYEDAVEDRPAFLQDLMVADADSESGDSAQTDDILTLLRHAPEAGHEDLLVEFLQGEVQAVLRLPSAPSPSVGFFDLGMDSLMAVELRNRLNRSFSGVYTAPNTLVFDYPDIAILAGHLAGELDDIGSGQTDEAEPEGRFSLAAQPGAEPSPAAQTVAEPSPSEPSVAESAPAAPAPVSAHPREDDGIAIVGMACRFPGAPDLDAFWRLLVDGADAISDGRRDAGPWNGVAGDPDAPDPAYRWGGYVDDIDKFDAKFFGIKPIEARMMDPRQRMLLETGWHALEDAGIDPGGLKGSATGVYAGVSSGDYRDLAAAGGKFHGYYGTTASVAAGRVAFALGLNGPAVPLDNACASSLVAVHQAVSALQRREVDLALVGGVNAILSPSIIEFMRAMGMLSGSGRCHAFDAAADGFVRGEGCGMIVLKRLGEALADGDPVRAVVRGSAVNQNGASAGLTVPNGPAQRQVIEQALDRAGIAPGQVDYLEAHGAASDLGDPIELQAAAAAYGEAREADRPLLVGSVKTNIGHLECAAGIASLIKAVLAMSHGVIPKHLHFSNPSRQLEWRGLPVQVTAEATDWPANPDRAPLAGVSSFGLSGTNAHVVVEGATSPETSSASDGEPADPRTPRMLPLSGKSEEALRDLAKSYLTWLDGLAAASGPDESVNESVLRDMAWTASVGRSHFARRAGVVFSDADSLRGGLEAIAEGDADRALRAPPRAAGLNDGVVEAAARAYEAGQSVSFKELFAGESPRRISIPLYPFQRRRFWIEGS